MRSFSASTLLSNWQEDRSRAPPLRGCVPDLGIREYQTTAGTEYAPRSAPSSHGAGPRFGMITRDTLNEAAYAYGGGLPASATARFSTTLTQTHVPAPEEATKWMKSTATRDALTEATQYSKHAATRAEAETRDLHRSVFAPAAGGAASIGLDKGKRIQGITGEVIRLGEDPKMSTAAQRAWIQRKDAGIHAYEHPPPPRPDVPYMSLHTAAVGLASSEGAHATVKLAPAGAPHGRLAAFSAAPRVVTDITCTGAEAARRKTSSVWADA